MPGPEDFTERQRELIFAIATTWADESDGLARRPIVFPPWQDVEHPSWPSNVTAPIPDDLQELHELGLIELQQVGMSTIVRGGPTPRGYALAQELGADIEPLAAFPAEHEWVDMVRVLAATLAAYEVEGQAGIGVRLETIAKRVGCPPHDPNLWSAVHLLAIDDYLDAKAAMPVQMATVLPLPRAYHLLRGWPSLEPENVTRRLDDALLAAIERTNDPQEKTKLQNLRDNARDVGKSVLAGAILAAGKYAGGGL